MSSLRKLRRRTFLAAMGLGIGAPLAMKMARLAGAAPAGRPTRLLIIFIPHGFPLEHFDPTSPSGDFSLTGKSMLGLAPLMPYQQSVTMVRGIKMADGATNHGAIRAALTGLNDGGNADSIDYVIGQALNVPAHVLGAIPYKKTEGFGVDSHLVKHGGAWVRATEQPSDAVGDLFAGLGAGGATTGGMTVDEQQFQNDAVALTEKQIDRMRQRVAGLSSEDNKLQIHLQALQGLVGNGGTGVKGCMAKPMLPAVDAAASIDPLDETQFGKVFAGHLEAAAQAMLCGTARVITLQCLWVNSNMLMNFAGGPGIPIEHHIGLSHSGIPREPYAKAQQWFFQQIADRVLKVLNQADPADPSHTVLDNSLVYVTTEVSDGADHNSQAGPTYVPGAPMPIYTYLPQLLIGGGGGYLKPGGRNVQVSDPSMYMGGRQHSDVLATIADAMGVPLTTVGGKPVSLITELKA
jgi:hypothetical protein